MFTSNYHQIIYFIIYLFIYLSALALADYARTQYGAFWWTRQFVDDTYKRHYKGTGSLKPQQLRKSDTKSFKQFCRTYVFASFIVGAQVKACLVCRERS